MQQRCSAKATGGELKNFTEQISILEREREIDAAILLKYMPQYDNNTLPVLARSEHESQDKSFANEREILYQVLFDMKKDMAEMKKVITHRQNCKQPYHCPHGRPTVITISNTQLRKEFERE